MLILVRVGRDGGGTGPDQIRAGGLKALDGQLVPVRGKVMWCRLITGRIHEIGIQFEEPIDLADFVPPDEEPEPDC